MEFQPYWTFVQQNRVNQKKFWANFAHCVAAWCKLPLKQEISKHLKSLNTEVSSPKKRSGKKLAAVYRLCLHSLPMILTNSTSDRPSGPARPCLPWLSTWSAVYRSKQLGSPQATSPASYGHFQKLLSIRFAFDSPRIGVDRQIT